MRKILIFSLLVITMNGFGQDSVLVTAPVKLSPGAAPDYIWVFSSPRLINANTVELLPKGILAFSVTHNFGDIAGDNGGIKNFFGLDNASDVRIGFMYGVSKKLNLIASRSKGASLTQLYELGLKYRFLQQANDPQHPLSLTLFANTVASAMKSAEDPGLDNSFENFSDRLNQTVQLLIARKFGNVSLQLHPTMVHRNFVGNGDDNTIFAMGGAIRLPVKGKFSIIADYFHSFRSQQSIDFFKGVGVHFHDALGVGIELLTAGHVFHLNFTNATEILENRFVPRTVTSWGKGEFRWGFTIARDFDLLFKKRRAK